MNKIVDFTEALAATKTTCDACSKELGGRYSNKPGSISMYLSDGEDSEGYPRSKEHTYCDETCARNGLNKRANKKK